MAKDKVRIRGEEDLQKAFKRLAELSDSRDIDVALMQGGLIIEGKTKINITDRGLILTGKMRASVKAFLRQAKLVWIVVGAFYAKFHEYGTSRIPARPFLRPAVDSTRREVLKTVARTLHIAIKRRL